MTRKMIRHNGIREVLRRWLYDHNIVEQCSISFSFEVVGRNVYIYTNRPGILIGYGGECVYDLTNRLKPYNVKHVRFVETGTVVNLREVLFKKRRWF